MITGIILTIYGLGILAFDFYFYHQSEKTPISVIIWPIGVLIFLIYSIYRIPNLYWYYKKRNIQTSFKDYLKYHFLDPFKS